MNKLLECGSLVKPNSIELTLRMTKDELKTLSNMCFCLIEKGKDEHWYNEEWLEDLGHHFRDVMRENGVSEEEIL